MSENKVSEQKWERIWPFIAAIAVIIALWFAQWYYSRSQVNALRYEVAKRLAETEKLNKDNQVTVKQTHEIVRELQSKITLLDSKFNDSQNQRIALEALYQELSRSRDEWVLSEIEQMLIIAEQQLQLANNVRAALTALQIADTRLSATERPQFVPLRKAINKDIERLRALPYVDVTGISLRLDSVMAQLDSLPLAYNEQTGEATAMKNTPPTEQNFWSFFKTGLWTEVKQLIQVRNIQKPDAALLSPTQSFFLRENLKLRLLNARLALLQHDQAVFREDIKTALAWLTQYFDSQSKPTQMAISELKQLLLVDVAIVLPNLKNSLEAIRNSRFSRK